MKPLSRDTPLSVEQLWLAGLRDKGPLWRFRRLVDMTSLCWHATHGAFQRTRPEATPLEQEAWLLQERYGHDLAHRVMEWCHTRGPYKEAGMTTNRELWDALLPVVEALVALGVPYYVGGVRSQ